MIIYQYIKIPQICYGVIDSCYCIFYAILRYDGCKYGNTSNGSFFWS